TVWLYRNSGRPCPEQPSRGADSEAGANTVSRPNQSAAAHRPCDDRLGASFRPFPREPAAERQRSATKWGCSAVIEHVFSHVLSRKVDRHLEAWVAAGQWTGALRTPDGQRCHLAFGWRYRLQSVLVCCAFGIACLAFGWYDSTAQQTDFWLVIAY